MKKRDFAIIRLQFRQFKKEVMAVLGLSKENKDETLPKAQARIWVDVLRNNYSHEDQNEIINEVISKLVELREEDIVTTTKDLKSLVDTNKELFKLKLSYEA